MPLRNRVTPFGEIVAEPWRGALMGNRGILHDENRQIGTARWRHANWVCCVTEFRGSWREPMPLAGARSRYTALFFWDEAAALAAGHRPCGECRHADWQRVRAAWHSAGLEGRKAPEIDRVLHAARVTRARRQVTHPADLAGLPDGVFLTLKDAPGDPTLKWQGRLWSWSGAGYADAGSAGRGTVLVLTPAPTVAAIAAGYAPSVRI
jgi:hypothetical protein